MLVAIINVHVKPEHIEGFKTASLDNASNSIKESGVIRFDAGDKLGVSLTTDATWAPTNTNDITAFLYVVYDPQ